MLIQKQGGGDQSIGSPRAQHPADRQDIWCVPQHCPALPQRTTYVHFVPDESFESVHDSLLPAFDYFGGVPDEILFENMKTAVIERDAYRDGQHRFHRGLLQMADDMGFRIRLCRPHQRQGRAIQPLFARELLQLAEQPGQFCRLAGGCRTANRLVDE